MTALTALPNTPAARAAWMRYRVMRDRERERGVWWLDALALFPWGRCPAVEEWGAWGADASEEGG